MPSRIYNIMASVSVNSSPFSNMLQPEGSNNPLTPPLSPSLSYMHEIPFISLNGAIANAQNNATYQSEDQNSQRDEPHKIQTSNGRVMVLCFDGTGNKFGENSNVVRLFRALRKNDRSKQIVYYQPGIGTYNKRAFITKTASIVASKLDAAVALHLNDHVKEGYQFIVQNYQPGDKICLFGFSRGAHTARVVAGMVYKVGILPRENIQQVDFAFSVYSATGYEGYKLGQEFKRTFTPIEDATVVDFVGVWDTVSSVGIIPRVHPYTSVNYAVRTFRHALALDERRARFRPNVWSEITIEREHELDIDIPVPHVPKDFTRRDANRDDLKFEPPKRKFADVKEVWFSGTHADVGGGSHKITRPTSLSFIPLRWMIKEAILAKTGIQFDLAYLHDTLDFDIVGLQNDVQKQNIQPNEIGKDFFEQLNTYSDALTPGSEVAENQGEASGKPESDVSLPMTRRQRLRDVIDDIFDQLLIVLFWWILEIIPLMYTYQNPQGNWVRRRIRNFGRGRYIPVYKNEVLVHSTVKERIEKTNEEHNGQDEGGDEGKAPDGVLEILKERFMQHKKYKPKAFNWNHLKKQGVVEYVD